MKLLKYQEFINEAVSKWKRSWVADDWDREIGSEYRPDEILEYMTSFHDVDSYDDTDFYERSNQYEKFILKMVDLDDLDLEEHQLDEWKVDEYIEDYKNENGKYPPIVIGETDYGYTIIDGLHRANALNELGKDYIKAYVGVGTPDYISESMINELIDSSEVYPYDKKEDIIGNIHKVDYTFKNSHGTNYTVFFEKKGKSWVRAFDTDKGYDMTGEGDVYNVLNTITKITIDFLIEYDVNELRILHIPTDEEYSKDRYGENKRARVNKIFLTKNLPDNYDYKLDGFKSTITKKGINESKEFDFENEYVWGRLREDGDTLKILDWNTKNKEKGGTIKALQDFRNEYDRIVAIDCGLEGEESFSYWTEMLNRGLIDEFQDDWGGIYGSDF